MRLQSNRFKGDAKRFEQIWQSSPDKSKKPNSRIYTLMSLMSFTDGWAAFLLWAPSSVSFMFPVRVNQSCVADRLFLQDYICELRVKLQGVWGVGGGGWLHRVKHFQSSSLILRCFSAMLLETDAPGTILNAVSAPSGPGGSSLWQYNLSQVNMTDRGGPPCGSCNTLTHSPLMSFQHHALLSQQTICQLLHAIC